MIEQKKPKNKGEEPTLWFRLRPDEALDTVGVEKAFIPPGVVPRACRIVLCITPGNPRIDAKTFGAREGVLAGNPFQRGIP